MRLIGKYFNILELHDKDYDKVSRSWIRARGKNLLKIVRKLLPKNYIYFLKGKLLKETGVSISEQAISEWINGRYGIPIIVLKLICKNQSQKLSLIKEIDTLNVNSIHKVILPKKSSEDLFYFYGALIGDGCLPNSTSSQGERQWRIIFHMVPINYVKDVLCNLSINLFNVKSTTTIDNTAGKQQSIFMNINSKIVYRFFERVIEAPIGKKASFVKIPMFVNLSENLVSNIISGIFDTESGIHVFTFGMSTNSKVLRDQILNFFINKGFKMKKWDWKNQKGNWSYSLGFRNPSLRILNFVRLRNKNVIELLRARVVKDSRRTKWSKASDLGVSRNM